MPDTCRNYDTLTANVCALTHLQELHDACSKEGISFLTFKGVVLAEIAYQDLTARTSCDSDILIRIQHLPTVNRILRSLGYTSAFCDREIETFQPNQYRNSILYTCSRRQRIPVHVYWHLINLLPYRHTVFENIDMEEVWRARMPVNIHGVCLYTFGLSHQLLYLSLHALSHGFSPHSLVHDIDLLIRSKTQEIQWDDVSAIAKRWDLRMPLYCALYLCERLYKTPIPSQIIAALLPDTALPVIQRYLSSAYLGKTRHLEEWKVYLAMNRTFADKFAFLSAALLPPRQCMPLIRQKPRIEIDTRTYLVRVVSGITTAWRIFLARP